MKILAIRGKNLASLANEFCVDFACQPLADAGLYAITGATGSGKSSLLDALCLALYEKTPRLARAGAPGEKIPDVGDHSVGPADPRNLLRRGASEGFAEVDFVGSDGVGYRARWSVRRARNRADGRLQASEMSLLRLTDQQRLGDNLKSETLKLIERCIGLSFEQFTRAVLLAQNDFAAFLKASDDDRAELLQTLTGTEAFTRISMRAFARARAEGEELKLLKLQLDAQAPMALEARAARDEQLATQGLHVLAIEARQGAIEAELRWFEQWAKHRANVAAALARADAARLAQAQAADRRAQFRRIEAVQPARPRCAEIGRLDRETAIDAGALQDGEAQLTQAIKLAGEHGEALERATRQMQAAETARSAAQPEVDRAKALDAQISALTPNHQAAVKAADDAQRHLGLAETRHRGLQAELAAALAARQEAERWLAGHASRRALATGWQRWETLLLMAGGLLGEQRCEQQKLAESSRQQAVLGSSLGAASDHHRRQIELQRVAAHDLTEQSQALAAFEPEEIARQKAADELLRDLLAGASGLWQDLCDQQQRQRQLLSQRRVQMTALDDCAREVADCDAARPGAERDQANAEKSLRIAELAASENVDQLRSTLVAGSPCPVCGSLQHPDAGHPLARVLDGLGGELKRTRERLTAIVQRASAAAARREATHNQLGRLDQDIAAVTAALQQAEQSWRAHPLASGIENGLAGAVAGDRQDASGDRSAWLADQQVAVRNRLAELGRQESAYREAMRRKDRAQAGVDQALSAVASAAAAVASADLAYQRIVQTSQSAAQRLAAIDQQLTGTRFDLDAAFADERWHERWSADADGFVVQCRIDVEAWTSQQRQVEELAVKIDTLTLTVKGALAALGDAAGYLKRQTLQCELLAGDLLARQAQRNALFEGRPVGAVDAALGAAIASAKAALTQAQTASQSAAAHCARQGEAVRQMASRLASKQARLGDERQALDAWRHEFNQQHDALSADALLALLVFAPDWIDAERQALQALDGAVANAQAVVVEHQKANAEHLAARPGARAAGDDEAEQDEEGASAEETDAAPRAALVATLAELAPAKAQLSLLQVELAQDDERRQRSQTLMTQVDGQSARARVWSQLSELIGSSDGKKFRNFAQQLTLDILLGYANRHLATLSRRYRLERIGDSLGLLVVDRDMGDEIRSVHSLSGGESFLVSLALALGLASLSSNRVRVESLFIDEGFGSLDADSLGVAMAALETLQAQGRKVGVISHVQEMTERIGTRIEIKRLAGGQSRVRVVGALSRT